MPRTGTARKLAAERRSPQSSRREVAVDRDHLERILERADERAGSGDPAMAYALYRDALALQREAGYPPEQLSRTLDAMATTRLAIGAPREAEEHFVASLAFTPYDHYALAGACHAALARGDRRAANRHAQSASNDVEVVRLAADHAAQELGDPIAALLLYAVALAATPEDPSLLRQIAELARVAGRHREAADATLALAELEKAPERRGRLYHRAARLVRTIDVDLAARCYDLALEAYFAPGSLAERDREKAWEPFVELDATLGKKQAWVPLERSLRAMIRRLKPEDPGMARLWHRLGEVNREHLGRRDAARQSYEVAAAIDADWMTNQRRLVEVYAEGGADELDKALLVRRRLFAREPFVPEHARSLRELFERKGCADQAYLAARVAAALGGAGPAEEALVRRHRPSQVRWPRVPLGDEHWSLLRLPSEDLGMTRILGAVASAIAFDQAVAARKLRLHDVRGPETEAVRNAFGSVARALGIPQPAHAVDPSLEGDVALANLRQGQSFVPTFVLGRQLIQRIGNAEVAFTLGRTLTHARPAYYLRLLLSDDASVEAAWHAALAAAGAEAPRSATDPMALGVARYLEPAWRAQLIGEVRQYLADGLAVDPAAWCRAVDALARRVGLLLSGDLEAAAAGVHREPRYTASTPHKERMVDLVQFMLSDEHARLRHELGLAIIG